MKKKKRHVIKKEKTTAAAINDAKVFFLALFVYILLFWLFPIYSFYFLFLVIGFLIIVLNGIRKENIYIGGLVGFLGSIFASILLTVDKYIYYVNTMPPYKNVNPDIPMSLYTNTLFNIVKITPLASINSFLFIIISTLLCAAFTQLSLLKIKNIKNIAAYVCLSVLAINFIFISLISSQDFAKYISQEPANLSYAYDAVGFLKTLYLFDRGVPYYKAYMEAQNNDSRRQNTGLIENGKYIAKLSPTYFRQPFIFYFWRFSSLGKPSRVLFVSILSCIFILILSYLAANEIVGEFSMLAPLFIYPFLFIGTTWFNIFFMDWWAGLFLFAGLCFYILKKYWLAALLTLFAILSREVIIISFFILFGLSIFKEKKAIKPILLAIIIFALVYSIHYRSASDMFINKGLHSQSITYNFNNLKRFTPNFSYMMFLYGFFKIPLFIVPILSLFGSYLLKRWELFLIVLYSMFHYMVGPSSYWGNQFNLIILFSFPLLLKFNFEILKNNKVIE